MTDTASFARALVLLAPASILATILTAGLILLAWPWLRSYALARPNTRSSHHEPTPQGGGIAVVLATLVVTWGGIALLPAFAQNDKEQFLIVTGATIFLAVVGAIDDLRTLPAAPRLVLQFIAVGAVIAALPHEVQILPMLPWWLERACLLVGGVWLVNLVNFMDGIDWITVAEVVPLTASIVVLGLFGAIGALPSLIAAALMGATTGFAPFNKPVARLFLGDVGSLPIGLLIGWLLLELARHGHLAAALILPLYYVADATITLARRISKGEAFWQAHRTHFYQRATDNGFTVPEIVARIFLVNLGLVALALVSVAIDHVVVSLLALAIGTALVAWLIVIFAGTKQVGEPS
jgi:UDP-N-acetylmuramyl pentapeptide phosphotransferase/UDP-N-acetylglucosamine-1-phosphate transferase